jgi:uncharacterized membrane protein
VIAPILLFLALVEKPVVPDNFYGFHVQSISGVFHAGSMLVMVIHAYSLIRGIVKTNRRINVEVKQLKQMELINGTWQDLYKSQVITWIT